MPDPTPTETQAEARGYLHFDGMTWPDPCDPLAVAHTLRHGTPEQKARVALVAASFIGAYQHLVNLPQRTRNARVRQIRKASNG